VNRGYTWGGDKETTERGRWGEGETGRGGDKGGHCSYKGPNTSNSE